LSDVALDAPFAGNNDDPKSLLTFLVSPRFSYIEKEEIEGGEYKKKVNEGEYQKQKETREERAKYPKISHKEDQNEIELRKHRSAYTALQILDATPREMMDLGASLREVERQRQEIKKSATPDQDIKKTPLLLVCVRDIVNQVKEEQSFLTEKEQNVLEGVLPTRHYAPRDIIFEMNRLRLSPSPRSWESVGDQLWVREQRAWDLTISNSFVSASKNKNEKSSGIEESTEDDDDDPFAKLPPRPAAWFILLHDLAWRWNTSSVIGNLVERLCREINDFRSTPTGRTRKRQVPFVGWAIWREDSGDSQPRGTYRHFPIPTFETVYEIDRFLYIWSREIQKLTDTNQSLIASIWALAGWIVLSREFENYAMKGDSWLKLFAATRGTLPERFEEFAQQIQTTQTALDRPTKGSKKSETKTTQKERQENGEKHTDGRMDLWVKRTTEFSGVFEGRKRPEKPSTKINDKS
jgi:hypothetical protein